MPVVEVWTPPGVGEAFLGYIDLPVDHTPDRIKRDGLLVRVTVPHEGDEDLAARVAMTFQLSERSEKDGWRSTKFLRTQAPLEHLRHLHQFRPGSRRTTTETRSTLAGSVPDSIAELRARARAAEADET